MSVTNTLKLNDRMTPVLRSIMKALNSTLIAMSQMDKVSTKSLEDATKAARKASEAIDNMGRAAERSTSRATRGQKAYTSSIRQSRDALTDLVEQAKALAITYGLFEGGKALVNAGDAYIGSTAQLNLMLKMNKSQKTAAELQDEIYIASQRSLGNYREMSKQVGKLGLLAREAFGGNTDEMVAFTELLNKQFSLSGATPWEKSAASYQLTQAMASGRLQGDEFRSIIENAPMLAQTIQEYMGLTGAAFKKASKDGQITADVIKNALFSVATETNEMFSQMPLKFSELWMQIINKIDKGLEPVYIKLRQVWNSKDFQQFMNIVVNGFITITKFAIKGMQMLGYVGTFILKIWDFLAPVILGATAALGVFFAAQLAGLVKSGIAWVLGTQQIIAYQWALFRGTVAQYGLNAAISACPLTWIIYAIIALVVVFYLVIAAINKFAGTSISATGAIVGVFMSAVAVIWNLFAGLGEIIWGVFKFAWNYIAMFVNFFANVWTSPITSVIYMFRDMGNAILDIIGGIASAIDKVFGTDLNKGVNKWKSNLNTMAKAAVKTFAKDEDYSQKMNTLEGNLEDYGVGRMGYKDSWDKGYNWGADTANKLKNTFTVGDKQYGMENFGVTSVPYDQLDKTGVAKDVKGVKNSLKDGVNLSDEDVQLLKDYARIQFTTHLKSLTPKVTATFGDVRENADVNVILKLLEKMVKDASESDLTT